MPQETVIEVRGGKLDRDAARVLRLVDGVIGLHPVVQRSEEVSRVPGAEWEQ